MGLTDLWSRRRKEPESNSISMQELLDNYELVAVNETPGEEYVVASKKFDANVTSGTAYPLDVELGTSASPWTSFTRQEYNPALMGLKGLQKYDKMRKSDGVIRGTLRAVKTPVLAARWFMQPGGDAKVDQTAATFAWKNLTELMSIGWTQVLTESMLCLDFGYYMWEKVWDVAMVDGQPRIILKKLAPRHPMDVKSWVWDAHGGPVGVWMYGGNLLSDDVFIPIEKLLVFTFDREAGDITGIPVLRSVYKHWYYKEQLYKIDAIQKERHGIGIPVIKLPMGYSDDDKRAAENLGRNIRTNERAHIVLPPGWEVDMLDLKGKPMDCLKSIELHDAAIRENILVNFIKEGANEDDITMFLKATRFIADTIMETFNLYLLPQMTQYNFARAKTPKLQARRIGENSDWRTMSFTLRNLVGANIVIPDDQLEKSVREYMDLPKKDEASARLVQTPQAGVGANQNTTNANKGANPPNKRTTAPTPSAGVRVGPPRQASVGNQRNTVGLPRSNAGVDRSGKS